MRLYATGPCTVEGNSISRITTSMITAASNRDAKILQGLQWCRCMIEIRADRDGTSARHRARITTFDANAAGHCRNVA